MERMRMSSGSWTSCLMGPANIIIISSTTEKTKDIATPHGKVIGPDRRFVTHLGHSSISHFF